MKKQDEGNKMKKKNAFFDEIIEGLNDIKEYQANTKKLRTKEVYIHPVEPITPKEVIKLRESLFLSQGLFAEVLGVSKKTLEAWEYGKNDPSGPSLRILHLIKDDPSILKKFGSF